MAQSGVLHRVLPGADAPSLTRLTYLQPEADPVARLAALGGQREGLRLSRADARRVETLREAAESGEGPGALGYRLGEADAIAATLLRAALTETVPPEHAASQAAHGATQTLPVSADDLMPALSGPSLGARLKELEARWIASGFTLTRQELLGS